jgi:hypothetical protein
MTPTVTPRTRATWVAAGAAALLIAAGLPLVVWRIASMLRGAP